jgi:hypothetical protein
MSSSDFPLSWIEFGSVSFAVPEVPLIWITSGQGAADTRIRYERSLYKNLGAVKDKSGMRVGADITSYSRFSIENGGAVCNNRNQRF